VPTRDPLRPHVERDAGVVVGRVTRLGAPADYVVVGKLGPGAASDPDL
jgi:hypothetical protein